jgi:hypothetical protein
MRASTRVGLQSFCFSLLLLCAAGCTKEVKADFPRLPATATLPPPEEEPQELPPEPAPEEPVPAEPAEVDVKTDEQTEEPPPAARRPREPAPPTEDEPPVEPPSTALAGAGAVDPALAEKLERASSLLESISRRSLTSVQADQLVAARGFVAQARQAVAEGDPRRAHVLIDKGLILAEDVDRVSRP